MKTLKKLWMGIAALLVIGGAFMVLQPHKAIADSATDFDKAEAACVENIVKGNLQSGDVYDNCRVNDPNGALSLTYNIVEWQQIENSHFVGSNDTTSVTQNGLTLKFPKRITLLDQNNNSYFTGDFSKDAVSWGSLNYITNSGRNTNKYWADKIPYVLYKASAGGAKDEFAVMPNDDGTMQMIAMISMGLQSGSPPYVYAVGIDQQVLCTDAKGNIGDCASSSLVSSTTANSTDSCENSGSSSLNWIVCPTVAGLSTAANRADDLIQGQLHISIKDNFGGPGGQIKTAWAVFKDIVSVLIVILLLIMVISQAIGSGPFDAYTVKKVLPKLVFVVFFLLFFWVMCMWVIGFFNDIGSGVAQLVAAPFGGQSALDLPSLLTRLSIGASATTGWVGGLVLAFAILEWPFMLVAAFSALMAVIAAVGTLLFRNALIILGVIVSPLALLAWAAPGQGTEKFWKYWYSNFSKALMLFPLVMGLIYGGRIFGWVAGNLGTPGLLDYVMVFVGYFGPYFFLPKTFRFGGSILRGANASLTKWQQEAVRAAKPGIKNFAETVAIGKKAEAYDPTKKAWETSAGLKTISKAPRGFRWLNGRQRPTMSLDGRAWRRMQSGHFLPTNRSRNLTLKRGEEWSSARTAEALAYEQKFSRTYQAKGIDQKKADEWNKQADTYARSRGYTGPTLAPFKKAEPGVGAGKQAALALFWQAYQKGDEPLQKAVADHLINSKSGLEFRNRDFIAPYFDPKTGKAEIMPFFMHPRTIDRAYKDPNLYGILSGLGGDFPPHNTPYGGKGGQLATGYEAVYRRGIRYIQQGNKVIENHDYNPDIARDFNIDIGQDARNPATPQELAEIKQKALHYKHSPVAAHYAQASYDDARNNISMGGSMGGAFMNALIDGATKGFVVGEGPNMMPLRQATWVITEAARTQDGRDNLRVILTDPSTREIAERMFKTAGITKFKDAIGQEHDFSIQALWSANQKAEQMIKDGKAQAVNPGRMDSLGFTGPNGQFVSIYNNAPPPAPGPGGGAAPAPGPAGPAAPQGPPAGGPAAGPAGGAQPAPAYPASTWQPGGQPAAAATPQFGPLELKIDHDALRETMMEGARMGSKLGTKQALRESGLGRPSATDEGERGQPFRRGPEWPSEGPPPGGQNDNE